MWVPEIFEGEAVARAWMSRVLKLSPLSRGAPGVGLLVKLRGEAGA